MVLTITLGGENISKKADVLKHGEVIRILRRVKTYCCFIMIEIVKMDMQLVLILFIVKLPAESYKSADFPSTECF